MGTGGWDFTPVFGLRPGRVLTPSSKGVACGGNTQGVWFQEAPMLSLGKTLGLKSILS